MSHTLPVWVELVGGGGIVAALGGIGAVFIRLGRFLQQMDDLTNRVDRLEDWQDGLRTGANLHR